MCNHEAAEEYTIGGIIFRGGDIDDTTRTYWYCPDCKAILTDEEMREARGENANVDAYPPIP